MTAPAQRIRIQISDDVPTEPGAPNRLIGYTIPDEYLDDELALETKLFNIAMDIKRELLARRGRT